MRLFFAIWPDASARRALEALVARAVEATGGKPTAGDKLHLTLEFLGQVELARIPDLGAIAAKVRGRAFSLRLDETGVFRRARVAWAGARQMPPALLSLHDDLAARLRNAGFVLEERPYAPHVTLARNAQRAFHPGAIEPVEWPVEAFSLVRSEPGKGTYATLASWPLR